MEEAKEFEIGDPVSFTLFGVTTCGEIVGNEFVGCPPLNGMVWVRKQDTGVICQVSKVNLQHEQPVVAPEEHPITFYNTKDDIPVGGFAKVGNEVYKVVKEAQCENCDFEDSYLCGRIRCASHLRKDETSVSFILYDTIPEDNDE